MFCYILDRANFIFFRNPLLDLLIDRVWIGNIVNPSNLISLLENEVSIIQDISKESMSFDIYLENTLHIHEFDVINQNETRMDKDNSMICN